MSKDLIYRHSDLATIARTTFTVSFGMLQAITCWPIFRLTSTLSLFCFSFPLNEAPREREPYHRSKTLHNQGEIDWNSAHAHSKMHIQRWGNDVKASITSRAKPLEQRVFPNGHTQFRMTQLCWKDFNRCFFFEQATRALLFFEPLLTEIKSELCNQENRDRKPDTKLNNEAITWTPHVRLTYLSVVGSH